MKKRLYTLNENYFENINSQDKAYFLGLIVADGNISIASGNRQPVLRIGLIDKEPLETFAKYLETNRPIYTIDNSKYKNKYSQKTSYVIQITSKKICDDLAKLGVHPRKIFNENIPNIPDHLFHHFVRGFFDGDGSVFLAKNNTEDKSLNVTLSSSYNFLNDLINKMNIYEKSAKLLYKDTRTLSNCWDAKFYNKSRSLVFYSYIYKDLNNDCYFKRKKEIFDNYIEIKVQRLQSAILEYKRIKV